MTSYTTLYIRKDDISLNLWDRICDRYSLTLTHNCVALKGYDGIDVLCKISDLDFEFGLIPLVFIRDFGRL